LWWVGAPDVNVAAKLISDNDAMYFGGLLVIVGGALVVVALGRRTYDEKPSARKWVTVLGSLIALVGAAFAVLTPAYNYGYDHGMSIWRTWAPLVAAVLAVVAGWFLPHFFKARDAPPGPSDSSAAADHAEAAKAESAQP
jgi:hypothetical protein